MNNKTNKETWMPVKGFEGKYKVSNRGRIWSIVNGKELHASKNNVTGYMQVSLRYE